jgi:FkbM family methyltransferase
MSLDTLVPLLQKKMPAFHVKLAVDVGAYIGEGALRILKAYPEARVFCVEPAPEPHQHLVANLADHPNAVVHRAGLSSTSGVVPLTIDKRGKGSRIVPVAKPGDVEIEVTTGDEFMVANEISGIDYLQIDTEGHDLEALVGFRRALADMQISLLQVEAGLHYGNRRHVPLEQLRGFLEPLGYYLFTLHQQRYEKKAHLRRCSAVFVSQALLNT